jgi:magnesium chelatase family protein
MTLVGLQGIIVNVEVDVSNGFPEWDIVGLPDMSIKESEKRIRIAFKNCGVDLLSKKYIINLSPADVKKEGSKIDLAIALGILKEIGKVPESFLNNFLIIGEISLDGNIKSISGALAICLEARRLGIKKILLPLDNFKDLVSIDDIFFTK